jgi:hypothetical protein
MGRLRHSKPKTSSLRASNLMKLVLILPAVLILISSSSSWNRIIGSRESQNPNTGTEQLSGSNTISTNSLITNPTSIITNSDSPFVSAITTIRRRDTDDPLKPECLFLDDPFDDLKDVHIYALVYYGRKKYVDVLNAYLERDLRVNGGVLDGVIFALVKYTYEDLIYLGRGRLLDHYYSVGVLSVII